MDKQLDRQIKFDAVSPLQFLYERISVDAKYEKQVPDGEGGYKKQKAVKRILKQCSGKFEPKTVTAILGPSGSGKTTMLNLLSGRLLSKNLTLWGNIKINGKKVQTMLDYKGVIGYVMQEDLMLPTFTPWETFKFITDMRLPFKTEEEKVALVESMIDSLGLRKCAQTYVGNSLIRGLSGGEKKRTSVGVELLINPSLIFLDEPTTGLDSTTALNLMKFLNRLAASGRTVVTTIHQPSSEIFLEFDMIMLMLDGHIVYHNRAADSMRYFSNLGMPVPVHSNPMDHYMKLMNKEGISLRKIDEGQEVVEAEVVKEFDERIDYLVTNFKNETKPPQVAITSEVVKEGHQSGWCKQMGLIIKRSTINELRNPLGIRSKVGQIIFFAVITIILYERQSSTLDSYLQNLRGLIFFYVMNISFSSIFGSINIFSQERAVYIRERLSNTYRTSPYFVGRSLAYLPLQLILPVLLISISYFVVHLNPSGGSFFLTIAACWLGMWMASAYGFFLSTAFADAEVALALVPILIIPLMLVGGYYAPSSSMPEFYRIFEYISVFKYLYQTLIYAQFYNLRDGWTVNLKGKDYHFTGDILSQGERLYFDEPYWLSMFLMGIIGLAIRCLSLLMMYMISNPRALKLKQPTDSPLDGTKIQQQKQQKQLQTQKPLKNHPLSQSAENIKQEQGI